MNRLEYVYLIRHKPTGKFYAGCSYGKKCHPSKFWIDYFTTSKKVKELILQDGKDSFEILEVIPRPLNDALEYEHNLLMSVNAAKSDNWLNKSNGKKKFYNRGPMSDETKNKMSKAKIGKPQSYEHISKRAESNKGQLRSNETRDKMSKSRIGIILSDETKLKIGLASKGRTASDDTKNKISEALTGIVRSEATRNKMSEYHKNKPKLVCPHCGFEGGGAMLRWHFDKCKKAG